MFVFVTQQRLDYLTILIFVCQALFSSFSNFFYFWFVTFFATCYTLSYHFLFVKHFFISLFVCFQHLLSFLKKQISVCFNNYLSFYDIVFILLLLCLYCFQATSNTIAPIHFPVNYFFKKYFINIFTPK